VCGVFYVWRSRGIFEDSGGEGARRRGLMLIAKSRLRVSFAGWMFL